MLNIFLRKIYVKQMERICQFIKIIKGEKTNGNIFFTGSSYTTFTYIKGEKIYIYRNYWLLSLNLKKYKNLIIFYTSISNATINYEKIICHIG